MDPSGVEPVNDERGSQSPHIDEISIASFPDGLGKTAETPEQAGFPEAALPIIPLTENIRGEIDPQKAHVDYDNVPVPDFGAIDADLESRRRKPRASSRQKKDQTKSKTGFKEIVRLGKRFLTDLWNVSPKLASLRIMSTVASSAATLFSLYAGGKAVKELINVTGTGNVSQGLLVWGGATILAGLGSLYLTKKQDLLTKRHDLRITFENYGQILSTIAAVPPHLAERRDTGDNITKVRRTEWKINGLCRAAFALSQSSTTTMMAAFAFVAAPQPIGVCVGTACLVLPGILSMYSYNRQAERADDQANKRTELEKRNNFDRVTVMNPEGIRDMSMRKKSGAFVSRVLRNFAGIQKSQESVVRQNNSDQTRTELFGHTATHAGWTGLALGVVTGTLDMAQFTFLASTLWHARRQLDIMCRDLGLVGENLRFMKPLYELQDIVAKERESREHIILNDAPSVVLSGIEYSYPGSDRVVLSVPNLRIPAGKRVAIVGDNGAGKSTFIKLISGVYMPPEGEIHVGGFSTKDYVPYFAMIAQDGEDFKGLTIREDVCMNLIDDQGIPLTDEAREILREISVKKEFGLDTRMHSTFNDGSGLSGGQRQIVALIGSLVSPARIKVRDEAFSALSPPNEVRLTKTIDEERERCTTFEVTHRLAAASTADHILVFEDGKISAQGSHQELLQQDGWYKTNYLEQQDAYSS